MLSIVGLHKGQPPKNNRMFFLHIKMHYRKYHQSPILANMAFQTLCNLNNYHRSLMNRYIYCEISFSSAIQPSKICLFEIKDSLPTTKQEKYSQKNIYIQLLYIVLFFSIIIIIMINPRVLYCLTLLVLVYSQPTVITNPTTVAGYALTCSLAPVSNLGLCNNTCFTCRAGSYLCATCSTPFVLSNMACLLDNNIHTYTVYRYLNQLNLASMAADIANFRYADTGVPLNVTKVIEVCRANLYESFAAGLFKITEVISLSYSYENKIDQISIKFNFMAVISSVTLVIDINGESLYVNEFDIFSDLSGRYGIDSNTSAPGYLFLDALSGSTADSIFYEVDTGMMSLIAQKIQINIYIKSSKPIDTYSWGFNDVVVVTRACETCVSQAVSNLIDKVIFLIWILAILVAVLILLLFTFIKVQAIKRKQDFQDKLGTTSDHLPLRALNRISESLKRSVITMEKQFKKEDRRFLKLMKRS